MIYKLLIVDDEKKIANLYRDLLINEGYDVTVVYNGQEALEAIPKVDPDIIMLDLIMPDKNGFEVLKEIREKYKDKWRPVIIVSADTDLKSIRKGYDLEQIII